MQRRIFHTALAALLLAGSLHAAAAGSISYRRVYELLYQFRTLPPGEISHLAFLGRVVNPAGRAPRRLVFRHADETRVIDVDGYGLFDIPMSPQLAQLNPDMIGEPAAEILRLGLAIVIRAPGEGAPDLGWLREGVRQTNAVMLLRARVAPDRVPRAHGVTLRFPPDSDARVVLSFADKEESFTADEEGRIDLPLDADATRITMTTAPDIIFPLFD